MADQPQHVGMLPALESPKHFADLHASVSVYIRDWLSPRLPNHYAISVERGLSMLDEYGEPERFRPDVRIDDGHNGGGTAVATLTTDEPTFLVDIPDRQQRVVTLRDADNNLVTTMEILSPANKTIAGLVTFDYKQQLLAKQNVNLVEIDLLRNGHRRLKDEKLARADYVMSVLRSGSETAEVWTTSPGQPLPTIPIPLREPDQPVALPLEQIMQEFLTKSGLGRRLK